MDSLRGPSYADRANYRCYWHHHSCHQQANYDALITSPAFDGLIRRPRIMPVIEELMGGPDCFGEIGLRYMGPFDGPIHRRWHRDRPHWPQHPLRMDYVQLMVYLTDVDESTHCISFSPESVDDPILEDEKAHLARGGVYDLHGPAGTCALFNVAALHTAATRPTSSERKTVQIDYRHSDCPPLSNDSGIPATLWRDHPDAETRAFYGVLNRRTQALYGRFWRQSADFRPD